MPSPSLPLPGYPASAAFVRLTLLAGWLVFLPLLAKGEKEQETASPRPSTQQQPMPAPGAAQSQRPVQENRFLIVVDTSAGMSRIDKGLRQTLFRLVHSGIRGSMQPGDTYGIWFFDAQTHTDYPMQVWNPAQNSTLAAHAVDYLAKLGYKSRPKVDALVRDLAAVIASVADVNVILLSDGATPIEGTPFDAPINALFKAHHRAFRLAREVFVTSLAARGGRWVSWSVNRSEDALRFARVNTPDAPRAEPLSKPQPVQQALAAPPHEPDSSAAPKAVTQTPESTATIATNPQTRADASAQDRIASAPAIPGPLATPETTPHAPAGPGAPPDPSLAPAPPFAELSENIARAPEPPTASATAPAKIPRSLAESVLGDALFQTHSEALKPSAPTAAPYDNRPHHDVAIPDTAAVIPVAAREPAAAADSAAKSAAPGSKQPAAGMTASAAGGSSAKTLFFLGLAFLAAGVAVLGIYVRLFHSGSSPSLISRSMQRK